MFRKQRLAFKGGGPICENERKWKNEICIEWRKKHSAPDVKPWSPYANSNYIKHYLELEQAPMKTEDKFKKENGLIVRFLYWLGSLFED